ncbi:hypothetical protein GL272_14060 [Aeromonas veronii]|uniref:hypothetical protein n=1 Tax=Aeromonas veronii TaxID=654 RepID=UPI001C5B0621|nr:hypothetical protein [Aeromonas veronii]MBW3778032.1 hypothetical protein [Aeromonas veronii]
MKTNKNDNSFPSLLGGRNPFLVVGVLIACGTLGVHADTSVPTGTVHGRQIELHGTPVIEGSGHVGLELDVVTLPIVSDEDSTDTHINWKFAWQVDGTDVDGEKESGSTTMIPPFILRDVDAGKNVRVCLKAVASSGYPESTRFSELACSNEIASIFTDIDGFTQPLPSLYTYAEADAICTSNGMRLPTVLELQHLFKLVSGATSLPAAAANYDFCNKYGWPMQNRCGAPNNTSYNILWAKRSPTSTGNSPYVRNDTGLAGTTPPTGRYLFTCVNSNNVAGLPIAKDLLITGDANVAMDTIRGSYTYYHPQGEPEGGTSYQWYRADDDAGLSRTPIAGATSDTYKVKSHDANKYMVFAVSAKGINTPVQNNPEFVTKKIGDLAIATLHGFTHPLYTLHTHAEAKDYCESIGRRLPTVSELQDFYRLVTGVTTLPTTARYDFCDKHEWPMMGRCEGLNIAGVNILWSINPSSPVGAYQPYVRLDTGLTNTTPRTGRYSFTCIE